VPVYNSCGGPLYGVRRTSGGGAGSWPGHGDPGQPGPLQDNWASLNTPGDLAEELLAAGFTAMKLWAADAVYRESGGQRVSAANLQRIIEPFRQIRERVGDRMDVMLDGHGFFSLPAALDIAKAMREVRPLWLEDVLRPDSISAMADLRRNAGVPIAVSEMLVVREQYRQVLEQQAADYVMIDPTWVGGISESRRIAELAQLYNVPVLMHDCTGPLTLHAGLTIAAAVPGVTYQECVRAHIASVYPQLIDTQVVVENGHIALSDRAGLGSRWLPELFATDSQDYRLSQLT
jgi:galactonate dehydratase